MNRLTPTNEYILGHADDELRRLIHQQRLFGELTQQLFQIAGVQAGVRVLDVGCGAGDVTFLAASMVGNNGHVIGVDKSPDALKLATQRAQQASLDNVEFLNQDLSELTLDEPVDLLVGRLILMYFSDPVAALQRWLRYVKPGGLVIFQEINPALTASEPNCPLFEATVQRIYQAFEQAGVDLQTSLKLGTIFEDAGLPTPQMLQFARVERGPDSLLYEHLAEITRTLLPVMTRTGLATAQEIDVDTLAARLCNEALERKATFVAPPFVGAWAQRTL